MDLLVDVFSERFIEHVRNTKTAHGFSDLHCRDEWGFDAAQMLRNNSSPHIITYLKYCKAIEVCPVCFMIFLLRDKVDLDKIEEYIHSIKSKN